MYRIIVVLASNGSVFKSHPESKWRNGLMEKKQPPALEGRPSFLRGNSPPTAGGHRFFACAKNDKEEILRYAQNDKGTENLGGLADSGVEIEAVSK
jgi:hypothetical protein